jgi:hypothetical protein
VSEEFPIVIAIPAKDEVELLPHCLDALARQTGVAFETMAVVVGCNNCTDGTPQVARGLASRLPFRLIVEEIVLPLEIAHAGGARRHAMDAALTWVSKDGILLTTDADGVVDHDWVSGMAEAFALGAAAVAGRVDTNWEQLSKFPPEVLQTGALEWEYQLLSAELEARIEAEPTNPWPRHNQTCGANAGIRADWYHRIGGLPVVRTGEDVAMFDAVFRRDGIVRNAMRPHVTVSARLSGRAQGGMADALTSRHGDDYLCDDLLEPADELVRRAQWRRQARDAFFRGSLKEWSIGVGMPVAAVDRALQELTFGSAWRALEANAPRLAKQRIPAAKIEAELARLKVLVSEQRKDSERSPQ